MLKDRSVITGEAGKCNDCDAVRKTPKFQNAKFSEDAN
jgi:hypothetical protein